MRDRVGMFRAFAPARSLEVLHPVADFRHGTVTANPPSTAPNARLTVGVGPVDFPDYLRRLAVVTRVTPNRIELSDEKRWAEPLDKNFTRVLSENLATLLNTQRIEKYPWPLTSKVDYQVEIDVQRFETLGDGQTQLDRGLDYQRRSHRKNPVRLKDHGRSARGPGRKQRVGGAEQRLGHPEQGNCLAHR